ncbi:MAG TPA: aspartyl-phosphate phosphatase Spo0E family protein [Methylomusa anaerophila]|uniref:aspartyl-phosphate phosphatase Spo0E family protein n=1 Tax=Methylomusa anaerophila TaxID=1930071 RepID=UPI0013158290|nr:aspartyl-phosphate phosphatase Spo0E family protein [Methylomusa anaerophila]HML89084.1 aspartyl-phosphate phosphatase Spo0E family protein [Methylomusa anaerophila]
MSEIINRVEEIETLREKLHRLVEQKGFSNPEVIAASQKLDRVIDQYHKLVKERQHNSYVHPA